jgi:hypothetical protein
MPIRTNLLNLVVAAALCGIPAIAAAQATSDELLDRLAQPDLRNWDVVEQQLYQTWSRSGSASADYLLRQGRAAMERDDAVLGPTNTGKTPLRDRADAGASDRRHRPAAAASGARGL